MSPLTSSNSLKLIGKGPPAPSYPELKMKLWVKLLPVVKVELRVLRVKVLAIKPPASAFEAAAFPASNETGPTPVLLTVSANKVEGIARQRANGAAKINARKFIVYLSSIWVL